MRSLLYLSFGLLVFCASEFAFAQEESETLAAPWISPWNAHNSMSQAVEPAVELPPPVPTGFTNIPVTTNSFAQTECSVAINPLDSTNIIVAEIDYDYISFPHTNGVYYSTDNGMTWTKSSIQGNSTATSYGDPWLAFNDNGTAYLCGLSTVGTRALEIHKSLDKGKSWMIDTRIFNTDPSYPDEPVLACDLNRQSPYHNSLYAAVVGQQSGSFFPGGIKLHYRRDPQSFTYSPEKNVSTFQLVQIPHITIGLGGKIYVSYLGVSDIINITGGLYFNSSTDGGDTWSDDHLISSSCYTDTVSGFPKVGTPSASRIGPTPRIAVDTSMGPRRGWLYVTYSRPSSGDCKSALDIYFQRSTDDGTTWSTPAKVNDDASGRDHLSPAMTVNPDGIIAIAYYDRRDDPNNLLVNTYCAISRDGGATFQNFRVSDQSTDPRIARKQTGLSIADYIAIAATRSAVYPVWTDGRTNNGDLNTYTARIPLSTNAVSDRVQKNEFDVYPNPVTEKATVRFLTSEHFSGEVTLCDALGRIVKVFPFAEANANLVIDFPSLQVPAGAYIIKLSSGSLIMTKHISYLK